MTWSGGPLTTSPFPRAAFNLHDMNDLCSVLVALLSADCSGLSRLRSRAALLYATLGPPPWYKRKQATAKSWGTRLEEKPRCQETPFWFSNQPRYLFPSIPDSQRRRLSLGRASRTLVNGQTGSEDCKNARYRWFGAGCQLFRDLEAEQFSETKHSEGLKLHHVGTPHNMHQTFHWNVFSSTGTLEGPSVIERQRSIFL